MPTQTISRMHLIHRFSVAGDDVLDVGSGLGVDSFIAAEAVGPAGSVTGRQAGCVMKTRFCFSPTHLCIVLVHMVLG
jgi:hypothetical protein